MERTDRRRNRKVINRGVVGSTRRSAGGSRRAIKEFWRDRGAARHGHNYQRREQSQDARPSPLIFATVPERSDIEIGGAARGTTRLFRRWWRAADRCAQCELGRGSLGARRICGLRFIVPGLGAPLLALPWKRVFFADEHTSRTWQGYMNGAVESGLRAAEEVFATAELAKG